MDKIKIKNLHIYAYHGVHQSEKDNGQNFYINSTVYVDTYVAGCTDNLEDTVSYSEICHFFNDVFTNTKYDLIEAAAQALAQETLIRFPAIKKIDVEVCKPEAPIGLEIDTVSVDITRMWHSAFIAIGSNMGDKAAYINKAIDSLKEDRCIRIKKISDMIVTAPYGGVEQDDFLNGAIEIETLYDPFALLEALHRIEKLCDRERLIHWGPRTLDLDIIFYDDLILNTEKLTIPHVDMVNRQFVLEPLCQIAPFYMHPIKHMSVKDLYDHLLLTADLAAKNSEG